MTSMEGVSESTRGPAAPPPSDSETLPVEGAPVVGASPELDLSRTDDNSRHALLVCISKYDHVEDCPGLPEAESARRLLELGFKVTQLSNEEGRLTRELLQDGIQKFVDCVKKEATGERPVVFVLFAGSSRRVDGQLEMLTSDTNPGEDEGYKEEDLYGHLDQIIQFFSYHRRLQSIFVFDAKHIVVPESLSISDAKPLAQERSNRKFLCRFQRYTIDSGTSQAPGRLTWAVMRFLAFKLPITRVLLQAAQDVAHESHTRDRPYVSVLPSSRDPQPPSLGFIEFEDAGTSQEPAQSREEWVKPSGVPNSSASSSRHSLLLCASKYDSDNHDLPGVSKDEADAGRVLRGLGFDVASLSDKEGRVTRRMLEEGIREFVDGVQRTATGDSPIVLVMFAGHAVQVGGQLHMMPSDAKVGDDDYFDDGYCEEDLNEALDGITKRVKFQFHQRFQFILIFDCCRDRRSSKLLTKKGEVTASPRNNDFYRAFSCDPGGNSRETEEGGALVQAVLRWLPCRLEVTTVLQMAAVDADPFGYFRPEVSVLPPPWPRRPPVVGSLDLSEVLRLHDGDTLRQRRRVEALTALQEDYEWNSSSASTASQQEPDVQSHGEAYLGDAGIRQTPESPINVTPTGPWLEPHIRTQSLEEADSTVEPDSSCPVDGGLPAIMWESIHDEVRLQLNEVAFKLDALPEAMKKNEEMAEIVGRLIDQARQNGLLEDLGDAQDESRDLSRLTEDAVPQNAAVREMEVIRPTTRSGTWEALATCTGTCDALARRIIHEELLFIDEVSFSGRIADYTYIRPFLSEGDLEGAINAVLHPQSRHELPQEVLDVLRREPRFTCSCPGHSPSNLNQRCEECQGYFVWKEIYTGSPRPTVSLISCIADYVDIRPFLKEGDLEGAVNAVLLHSKFPKKVLDVLLQEPKFTCSWPRHSPRNLHQHCRECQGYFVWKEIQAYQRTYGNMLDLEVPQVGAPTLIVPEEAAKVAQTRMESFTRYRRPSVRALAPNAAQQVCVLRLSRISPDIDQAIMRSHPAQRLQSAGINPQPEWAAGAKNLVPGWCALDLEDPHLLDASVKYSMRSKGRDMEEPDLFSAQQFGMERSDVVLMADEEKAVLRMLRSLRQPVKPGVKWRIELPADDSMSLAACSSWSEDSDARHPTARYAAIDHQAVWQFATVKNGFIDELIDSRDGVASRIPRTRRASWPTEAAAQVQVYHPLP